MNKENNFTFDQKGEINLMIDRAIKAERERIADAVAGSLAYHSPTKHFDWNKTSLELSNLIRGDDNIFHKENDSNASNMAKLLSSKLTKEEYNQLADLIDSDGPAGEFWEAIQCENQKLNPEEYSSMECEKEISPGQ